MNESGLVCLPSRLDSLPREAYSTGMTTKEALIAWARRMAAHEGVENVAEFVIQSDGFVYAMRAKDDDGPLAWWPLPYLGPEGEADLEAGALE